MKNILENLWIHFNEIIILLSVVIIFIVPFIFFVKKIINFIFNKIDQKFRESALNNTEKVITKRYMFHSLLGIYITFWINLSNINNLIPTELKILLNTGVLIYLSFSISMLLLNLIDVIFNSYKEHFLAKHFPLHIPIQILKIFIISSAIIIDVARIANLSPLSILTSLGATTAFLTFVFKDAISGLIASLQLIFQNKIQIDDWISIPQYNIKGQVEKITITEVKIRTCNGSIVTVPPYNLLTTNIVNWRNTKKLNPRNINRIIYLDINSIIFISSDNIEQANHLVTLINDYKIDYNLANLENKFTNLEIYKIYIDAYLKEYLRKHNLNINFQLFEPETDVPGLISLEINIFLKEIEWAIYTKISSDIFFHLIAILPEFQLKASSK